jgi:hypothetical protein
LKGLKGKRDVTRRVPRGLCIQSQTQWNSVFNSAGKNFEEEWLIRNDWEIWSYFNAIGKGIKFKNKPHDKQEIGCLPKKDDPNSATKLIEFWRRMVWLNIEHNEETRAEINLPYQNCFSVL